MLEIKGSTERTGVSFSSRIEDFRLDNTSESVDPNVESLVRRVIRSHPGGDASFERMIRFLKDVVVRKAKMKSSSWRRPSAFSGFIEMQLLP